MEGKEVLRLEVEQADLGTMGGKGANLARLIQAGFPVPGGFVVPLGIYRTVNGRPAFRPNTIAALVCLVPLVSVAGAALRKAIWVARK